MADVVMPSLETVAKYLYFRALGTVARNEQPFATHMPVLVGVAAACLPERLVEFGSGNFSTLAFLDEAVFPSLLRIESYENDLYWMQQTEAKLAGNPRVAYRFFEGRMRDAVHGADPAAADLIFIDDSMSGWERAHTVREVARNCGERPITIVHDYELPAVRLACRRFEHRFAFTTFTPQTCAVWNGNPHRRALLERIAQSLEENASRLSVTDARGWAKVFRVHEGMLSRGQVIRQITETAGGIGDALALSNAVEESSTAQKTVCFLCGSPLEVTMTGLTDNRLGTPGTYEIHRCVRCDLEQTFPVPTLAELKKLYETHYNFGGESDTLYTRWRERFLFSPFYLPWTRLDGDAAFYRRTGKGRLLDVGCNEGRGLRIYARNGFQAEGLDLNEAAAAVAREAGLTVHTRLLEEFHPEAPYDVVVLSNVMEHALDPKQMLLEANRILGNGGQVWISCPNSESWLRKVFGKSWINWHVPFHTFHFSSKVLRRLLAESGYTGVETRSVTPAPWVAQSMITYFFARKGNKNRQLRNPFLVGLFMLFVRFILFPVLWLGNRRGRGDCLLAMATKAQA